MAADILSYALTAPRIVHEAGKQMKIYPEEIFDIETGMTTTDVYAKLDAVVATPKWLRVSSGNKRRFRGEFTGSGFKIVRIIGYRNSFLPVIVGSIKPAAAGCRIAITMRLQRFTSLFMLFWLGGVSIILGILLAAALNGYTVPMPAILVPAVLLLFGSALMSGCFWWEVKKTKPLLREMFAAENVSVAVKPGREAPGTAANAAGDNHSGQKSG